MNLYEVCHLFEKRKIPYAIVGGYAVALHGALRGTLDIDFIIKWTKKNLFLVEETLREMGLSSRLPIDASSLLNFKEEYLKNRNLIAWNFYNPKNLLEQIDIIITHDLKNYKVKKIKTVHGTINVLSLVDLITMKKQSNRPQDLEDVKSLEKIHERENKNITDPNRRKSRKL